MLGRMTKPAQSQRRQIGDAAQEKQYPREPDPEKEAHLQE
jgi:hypothetical protein